LLIVVVMSLKLDCELLLIPAKTQHTREQDIKQRKFIDGQLKSNSPGQATKEASHAEVSRDRRTRSSSASPNAREFQSGRPIEQRSGRFELETP